MRERLRGQVCNIAAVFYEEKVSAFLYKEEFCIFICEDIGILGFSAMHFLQKLRCFFRKMKRKIVRFPIA